MSVADEFAVVVDGWFDGETRRDGPATFRVESGQVAAIAEGDRSGELASRGVPVTRGAFLLPGLVDAHVHLFLDGPPTDNAARSAHLKQTREALVEAARGNARQALACGVTKVRDAGDKHGINHAIRAEAATDDTLAHVRSSGLAVRRPRRYGAFMAREVADDAAIRNTVTELSRDSDEIKLILTGIINFEAGAVTDEPQFDLHSARLVTATARANGRKTFAHCSGEKGLAIAARAGVDSIEHGFFMTREILSQMRDRGIAWTPTFCPVHFQWAHPEAVGWSEETVGNLRRILDHHAEHLCIAREMGVTLLLGTDAGSMGVDHGHAVFDEMERYVEAGLSLDATLRAATANARRHFDDADPRLARGSRFEAILLDASPFDRLDSLRQPRQVFRG